MDRDWCQHCKEHPACKSRKLCHICYYREDIRILYDMGCERGLGANIGMVYLLPSLPCNAYPGTIEKIKVMSERAKLGVSLFHPDDAKLDEESVWRVSSLVTSHV